jgi:hypothetical protein
MFRLRDFSVALFTSGTWESAEVVATRVRRESRANTNREDMRLRWDFAATDLYWEFLSSARDGLGGGWRDTIRCFGVVLCKSNSSPAGQSEVRVKSKCGGATRDSGRGLVDVGLYPAGGTTTTSLVFLHSPASVSNAIYS